jgi:hypothetical protein
MMTTKNQTAATPWEAEPYSIGYIITDANGMPIATEATDCGDPITQANAELIVKAVNEHAALVAVAEVAELLNEQLHRFGSAQGTDQCQQHWDEQTDAAMRAYKLARANLAAICGGAK